MLLVRCLNKFHDLHGQHPAVPCFSGLLQAQWRRIGVRPYIMYLATDHMFIFSERGEFPLATDHTFFRP